MQKSILELAVELTNQQPVAYSGKLKAIVCPFHDDHKPSLVIYTETDSWYCYSCSQGGDAYKFYSLFKGVSYKAAREFLEGDRNKLEEITQMLDGLHVVDVPDFSQVANLNISRYCRELMYSKPEVVNNVILFLKKLDNALQNKMTFANMKTMIKESRELSK